MTSDTVDQGQQAKRPCPAWTAVAWLVRIAGNADGGPCIVHKPMRYCEDTPDCAFRVSIGDGETGCGLVRGAVEYAELLPEVRECRGSPEFVEFEDSKGDTHIIHQSRLWLHWHGEKHLPFHLSPQFLAIIADGGGYPITPAVYADLRARLLGEEPQDPRYDALAAICRGLGFTSSVEVDYNHAPPRIGILLCDHADAQDRRLLAEVLATFVERHGCPAVTVSVEEAKA